MRRWSYRFAVVLCVFAAMTMLWGGQAYAMPPVQEGATTIPYTGQLAGPDGAPVADGIYTLRFALYADPAEGEALWTAEFDGVAVVGGLFSVTLEPTVPYDKTWLAIWVRGPGEADFTPLEPRLPFDVVNAPVSTAAINALSCDHSHLFENWEGSNTEYSLRIRNTANGDGLRVYSAPTLYNYAAIYAVVTSTGDGSGVYGRSTNGRGVYGASTSDAGVYGGSSTNAGVYGISTSADGVVGSASATNKSGVYGVNTAAGFGMYGRSTSGFGIGAAGAGDANGSDALGDLKLDGVRGEIFGGEYLNLYANKNVSVNLDQNNNDANSCLFVFDGANVVRASFCENGTKSAVLETDDFGQRKVYAMESPEVWLEDFGTAALVNGVATVTLDPIFVQMISQSEAYHVFVTPLGESGVLYVADKGPGGFTVMEAAGGDSNVAFDWRIAAKRAGLEGLRTEVVDAALTEQK